MSELQKFRTNLSNMEVRFWINDLQKRKYLYGAECFENALLNEFEIMKKSSYYNKSDFDVLDKEINNSTMHPQDVLHKILEDNIFLDFGFAKQLNIYDSIGFDCFELKKGKNAKAIIKLAIDSDISLILISKKWHKNYISLGFLAIHMDFECDLIMSLYNNLN